MNSTVSAMLPKVLLRVSGGLSQAVSIAGFLILLTCLLGQFFFRTFLNTGLMWADELARLSFVWCALFGAVAAWHSGGLHRIDMFTRELTGIAQRATHWVVHGLVAATLLYLVWWGCVMVVRAFDQTTETLEISGAWLYIPIPAAATLMLLVTFMHAVTGIDDARKSAC